MTELPAPEGAAPPPDPDLPALVGFDEFAVEFRRRAVTEDRVVGALESLASRELRLGPYSAGPLARFEASGTLGTPTVRIADPDGPTFAVTVPATLDLSVRLGALSRVAADVEIDLLLTPRPADELFLFIDAAPVEARDVRISVHGKGLGLAVSGVVGGLPAALTDEVRRQVAKQIRGVLTSTSTRRARTIDIASRVDGAKRRPAPDTVTWVSDAEFGRQFVARAVSIERVSQGFGSLTGQSLTIGPLKAGPGGIAGVRATGTVETPDVVPVIRPDADAASAFAITLPLQLDLTVDLAREHRFHAEVVAQLRAVPRPADRLRILIDIPPLEPDDIAVTLEAADNLAGMLGRAGKVDEQVAAQVRRVVNERIGSSPHRVVDVAAIVGGGSRGADRPKPRPRPRPS